MAGPFSAGDVLLPRVGRVSTPGATAPAAQPPQQLHTSVHTFVNHNLPRPAAMPPPPLAAARASLKRGSTTSTGDYPLGGPPAGYAAARPGARGMSVITYGSPTVGGLGAGEGEAFGVEGVRTGEEVVVSDVDRRQPRKSNAASSLDAARDERRLQTLQAELRAMAEKLRKSQSARQKQKEVFTVLLEEAEARRVRELAFVLEHREAAALRLANELARSASGALAGSRERFDREVSALRGRITEARAALEAEQQQHAAAAQAAAAAQREAESAKARDSMNEVERLRALLEEEQLRAARERQQLEVSLAETQDKLRLAMEAGRRCEVKIAEDMFLMAQCRLFVKQVCQPGFSVVKNATLEPVEKDRAEPTGYVLVPLVVLLHGYALLPVEDRKNLIEHYETRAARTLA